MIITIVIIVVIVVIVIIVMNITIIIAQGDVGDDFVTHLKKSGAGPGAFLLSGGVPA